MATATLTQAGPAIYQVEAVTEDGGTEIATFSGPNALTRAMYFCGAIQGSYYSAYNDPQGLGPPGAGVMPAC